MYKKQPANFYRLQAVIIWSGLRGSNPPPRPWQGRALPNELNPRAVLTAKDIS